MLRANEVRNQPLDLVRLETTVISDVLPDCKLHRVIRQLLGRGDARFAIRGDGIPSMQGGSCHLVAHWFPSHFFGIRPAGKTKGPELSGPI